MLTNRIEATNNAKFKDLALGFRLELKQDGDRVTGTGTKVSENEQVLAPTRQTPISVEGPMAGDRLELTFTERGAQRATTGKLSLQLADVARCVARSAAMRRRRAALRRPRARVSRADLKVRATARLPSRRRSRSASTCTSSSCSPHSSTRLTRSRRGRSSQSTGSTRRR